ncbi:MAG: diguanylate cyclase [Nitrospirae bacterium]|nr:diguanylate cyclase [Nitrospirota bacterium]
MKIMSTDKNSHKDHTEFISLDLIPDPFIILRPDGTIVDANLSFFTLVGSGKETVISRNFNEIDLLRELSRKISQSFVSGSEDFERIAYHTRHFEVLILPFRHADEPYFIRIVLKDITNFIRLEKELLKRNKELIIINTLSSAFISSENMDLVMEDLIEKVLLITDFHTGFLMMTEDEQLKLRTSKGISSDLQKFILDGGIESLCSDALKIQEPMYFIERSVIAEIPVLREEGFVFIAAIPLLSSQKVMGLLFLASRVNREMDFDFAALLSLVGNHFSHILDKIKLFQETKRLSVTDGLTGLFNSRYFYRYLDLEISRTKRYGSSFSLMLFDIDNFKKLNDTYGHQAGDEVLQELARIFKSVSRETDIVVRYGGEEFVIILPNTAEDEAIALANRILLTVQETKIKINATERVSITISGGVASFPQNASTAKNLLNAADSAMYAAKTAGKNTIVCYQGKMREKKI